METPDSTVAVILAGGAGTRMAGADKARLVLEGRTFLERVIDAVAGHAARVVVVAAEGQNLGTPAAAASRPILVVRDSSPAAGPLAAAADGIEAAIAAANDSGQPPPERVFLVSCDVPSLSPRVVGLVLDRLDGTTDWAVPVVHGHPQVLVSAVRPRLLRSMREELAAGRSGLRGLLNRCVVTTIDEESLRSADPSLESFLDVDTPGDLARLAGGDGPSKTAAAAENPDPGLYFRR